MTAKMKPGELKLIIAIIALGVASVSGSVYVAWNRGVAKETDQHRITELERRVERLEGAK